MADVILYGVAPSTYVRTARLALAEKGVDYALEAVAFGSDALRALHPFEKIPALRHGDFLVYETAAIARYVDEAFDGPALQPADARGRADMTRWISAVNAYYDPAMVRIVVAERVLAPMRGRAPDEARIREAMPRVAHQLDVLEAELAGREFLAGAAVSLADFFLLPVLFYLGRTPEGEAALAGRQAIARWQAAMEARPSAAATAPPAPGKAA